MSNKLDKRSKDKKGDTSRIDHQKIGRESSHQDVLAVSVQCRIKQPYGRDDDVTLEGNQQTAEKPLLFNCGRNVHNA
jgi:hypothetical protein